MTPNKVEVLTLTYGVLVCRLPMVRACRHEEEFEGLRSLFLLEVSGLGFGVKFLGLRF